jgi:hypothetical protein
MLMSTGGLTSDANNDPFSGIPRSWPTVMPLNQADCLAIFQGCDQVSE